MSTPFKDRKPPSDSEIREYFRILKNDPKSRVFAPLAEALIRRGRLEEAEQLCIHGTEKNNHFSDGHLAYARVLFYLFRYIDALEEVKKALALDSSNIDAYLIAAEIFLSRSQIRAASDACMKVLDMDSTNAQAMQILKKLNAGTEDTLATDGRFTSISGTAPSSKRLKSGQAPSMTNPFEQLMHELHHEGAKLLDEEQPFTALSSGSQVEIPVLDEQDIDGDNEEFMEQTQPINLNDQVPKLPAHPPTPAPVQKPSPAPSKKDPSPSDKFEDILSRVPKTPPRPRLDKVAATSTPAVSARAPASDSASSTPGLLQNSVQPHASFSSQSQITSWQRIDAAQNIIDSYRDRIPMPSDEPPPKFSRLPAILSSLGFIGVIAAVVILIVYLLSIETKQAPMRLPERRSYKPPVTQNITHRHQQEITAQAEAQIPMQVKDHSTEAGKEASTDADKETSTDAHKEAAEEVAKGEVKPIVKKKTVKKTIRKKRKRRKKHRLRRTKTMRKTRRKTRRKKG